MNTNAIICKLNVTAFHLQSVAKKTFNIYKYTTKELFNCEHGV